MELLCKTSFRRKLRTLQSYTLCWFVVLYVVTFFMILPVICRNLPNSKYFVEVVPEQELSQQLLREDQAEYDRLQTSDWSWSLPQASVQPFLLIVVITQGRSAQNLIPHYLSRSVRAIIKQIREDNLDRTSVLICDVGSDSRKNPDLAMLEGFLDIVRRNTSSSTDMTKQKQDYIFCLTKAYEKSASYYLLMEDDGLPNPNAISQLQQLLKHRIEPSRYLRSALFYKLFHPTRLLGYINPESFRILEWAVVGVVGGLCMYLFLCYHFRMRPAPWKKVLFVLYIMMVTELVGRANLVGVRKAHWMFFSIVPAPECCFVAVLYPHGSLLELAAFYGSDTSEDPLDIVIYQYMAQQGRHAFYIEPNLFSHIGLVSNFRGIINPYEMN